MKNQSNFNKKSVADLRISYQKALEKEAALQKTKKKRKTAVEHVLQTVNIDLSKKFSE